MNARRRKILALAMASLAVSVGGGWFLLKQSGDSLKRNKVEAQMAGMASGIELFSRENGHYPTLTEFNGMAEMGYWAREYYKDNIWGNEFIYEPSGDGSTFVLRWLGRDGRNGGRGVDADLVTHGR